jgi:hypothetical protein
MTRRSSANTHRPSDHLGGAATARVLALVVLWYAVAAVSSVASPAAVYAYPSALKGAPVGMYGEPDVAARYWREQSTSDCGEMAVADVVGELTDRQPTEQEVIALAERTSSAAGHGSIWKPSGLTDIRDIPILLSHYGIAADNVQTDIDNVKQKLGTGRKVIAIVNAEIIWNRPSRSDFGNHFVVVTGIDARSGIVHLNDSAMHTGRDEKVSIGTFERAWAPSYRSAVVTH